MRLFSTSRILLLVCALLVPADATAQAEASPHQKAAIESRRKTKEAEMKSLQKQREMLLKQNQPTDTIDLGIEFVQEELDILATGKIETKDERLKRNLSKYKRQRELHIKLGQSTAGLDKMIESTEHQLGGASTTPNHKPQSGPKPASPKPGPALTEKVRQDRIEGLKRSINSLQKSIGRYRDKGKPVPQMLLDTKAKYEAQLAELQK